MCGPLELRSQATTSAAWASPSATSRAAIDSTRTLVAQACATVGPATRSAPTSAVSHGRP